MSIFRWAKTLREKDFKCSKLQTSKNRPLHLQARECFEFSGISAIHFNTLSLSSHLPPVNV